MSDEFLEKARAAACRSAVTAWASIGELYEKGSHIEEKVDGPSTEADKLADRIIQEELMREFPASEFGYLTEETEDNTDRLERDRVWIIDPIDGTKDFILKNGNFAMHVGLVERGEDGRWHAVAAAVYRPALGEMYSAIKGQGARLDTYKNNAPTGEVRPLLVSSRSSIEQMNVVVSNSHRDAHLARILAGFNFNEVLHIGSIGIKLSLIAGGGYDVYINAARGKCKEWDICAPDLILSEAGGIATDLLGEQRDYNLQDPILPEGLLASNGTIHEQIKQKILEIEAEAAS